LKIKIPSENKFSQNLQMIKRRLAKQFLTTKISLDKKKTFCFKSTKHFGDTQKIVIFGSPKQTRELGLIQLSDLLPTLGLADYQADVKKIKICGLAYPQLTWFRGSWILDSFLRDRSC